MKIQAGLLSLSLSLLAGHAAAEPAGPRVGDAAPAFTLQRLDPSQAVAPAPGFAPAELRGKVWVLNVWASWCGPCRAELPELAELATRGGVPVIGLSHRDTREKALAWLAQHGNPFRPAVLDADGKVGSAYGVASLPETFVIDQRGVIRLRLSAPLTPELLRERVLPVIEGLKRRR